MTSSAASASASASVSASASSETSSGRIAMALKEWAIAIEALLCGEQILLLRKGGIREGKPRFEIPTRRVLLYPTYEHQKPELLKPAYAELVQAVDSGWHPERVKISAWADITHVIEIAQAAQVEALLPYHCWNDRFAAERFRWKPQAPLNVLLLRTYRLAEATELDYRAEFGGCTSWLDWPERIDTSHSTPVLSDADYAQVVAQLHNVT